MATKRLHLDVDYGEIGAAALLHAQIVQNNGAGALTTLLARQSINAVAGGPLSTSYSGYLDNVDEDWEGSVILDNGGAAPADGSGATWQMSFNLQILLAAPQVQVTVNSVPLQSSIQAASLSTTLGVPVNITLHQHQAAEPVFIITDGDDLPVDVSAKTLRFLVFDNNGTVLFTRETGDGITVGGVDKNQVTVNIRAVDTATDGRFKHGLRDTADNTPLAAGKFLIEQMPKQA